MNAPVQATVHVVDDDASIRELLVWLMRHNGFTVRAFPDARSFLAGYEAGPDPECLLLDLNLPGMNGLELQQALKARGVSLPVVFLSGRGDIPRAVRAVREGAIDFLEKPFDYKRVVDLVREALERDRAARGTQERKRELAGRLAALTQREREVLDLVVAGRMNREIAESLDISIKTVEAHRSRLMEKLDVGSVAELVAAVMAAG